MTRALLLFPFVAACQQAPKVEPVAAASASASSAAVAAPPAAAAKRAWFEGAWQGAFKAELQ
ncbi:MAG TPA: hypothetical protein VEQ59_19055, partial [Polyangiaceae bacterium]|nr:hypothetical protein [Polyangiaceae bacterium]